MKSAGGDRPDRGLAAGGGSTCATSCPAIRTTARFQDLVESSIWIRKPSHRLLTEIRSDVGSAACLSSVALAKEDRRTTHAIECRSRLSADHSVSESRPAVQPSRVRQASIRQAQGLRHCRHVRALTIRLRLARLRQLQKCFYYQSTVYAN